MLTKIVLGLGIAAAALAALVASRPSSFVIERSAEIAAPAAVLRGHIENLRALDAWMPWGKLDPEMKAAYQGPESGVGARSSWQGPQMGTGRITITAVEPEREVEMRLEMLEPMQATNRVLFTLEPTGPATRVTWRLEGENGFVAKAFSLFVDMDETVGAQFEQGLANLDRIVRSENEPLSTRTQAPARRPS
jgi:hypothetical protein